MPINRYFLFFGVAIVGAVVDLATKELIFRWRGMPRPNNEWWIWGLEGYVGIETALNPGALFGMFAGWGTGFAILSVIAGISIVTWLFIFKAAADKFLTFALGCVSGGIIGNLYDRLGLWHPPGQPETWRDEVRDWILFRYGNYTWPNFNIADCLLVCGAAMLVLHSFWQKPKERPLPKK